VDYEKALSETLKNLHGLIQERKPLITHDPLPRADGYYMHIVRLFQNLIGNAIKYCEAERPIVHVSCQEKADEYVIAITDNGIGFEMKDAQKVFGLFERLPTRETKVGSGLGLAVCKRIVERQGGRIWAQSRPGRGSTFYFTISKSSRDRLQIAVGDV
jgi:light-regulated signal transduction histidine kinase (bacteriophytochrome)